MMRFLGALTSSSSSFLLPSSASEAASRCLFFSFFSFFSFLSFFFSFFPPPCIICIICIICMCAASGIPGGRPSGIPGIGIAPGGIVGIGRAPGGPSGIPGGIVGIGRPSGIPSGKPAFEDTASCAPGGSIARTCDARTCPSGSLYNSASTSLPSMSLSRLYSSRCSTCTVNLTLSVNCSTLRLVGSSYCRHMTSPQSGDLITP
mmetsp:Transcript_64536/g.120106  ORF Transcript_64536/g.120106 Transcript_64536/m.120106 type:complete len:204 (+) Transcript_64536:81-692(+)